MPSRSSATRASPTRARSRAWPRRAGASTGPGPIDRLWRDGLAYFGQPRYVGAKAEFDQCASLNKVQVGCADMAKRAAAVLSQDEEAKYAPRPAFPVGLL